MKYLILLFLSSALLAQTVLQCPPESILIEFISPVTGGKKSFCGYQKDGQTVKHGEEWSFDRGGVLVKKTSYQHGREGDAPKPVDEAKASPSADAEAKILETISDLLQILTLKKANIGKGMFKVQSCDPRPSDWLKGALFNSPINKSYSFGERCDVQGRFIANFGQEFPMNFELRNLQDFTKTDMSVKMSINKSPQGIRYRFDVLRGAISALTRNANFRVEYEVDINPMTGEAILSSQQGKVMLTKIDGKDVKAESSLKYDN